MGAMRDSNLVLVLAAIPVPARNGTASGFDLRFVQAMMFGGAVGPTAL